MSGTEQPASESAAPAEPVVATPAPEVAPVAAPEPPTAAVETPAATPEPAAAETKPAITPHTETPTLLEQGAKPEGDKAKPADTEQQPAPTERVYETFTLPEGIKPDPEQMTAYTTVLARHNLGQEVGQELLTLHAGVMQRYADQLAAEQHRVFADTRANWRNEVMADEQIGGAGHRTAMQAIARMRDLAVPEVEREKFDEFLRVTGAGDHPAFLRMLHNFARYFDEPRIPETPANPTPDRGGNAPRGFRRVMYDHPSSQKAANG